jgi:hypothetical protein
MNRVASWLCLVALAAMVIPALAGCSTAPPPQAGSFSSTDQAPEAYHCVGPGCPIPGPDGKIVPRPAPGSSGPATRSDRP